MREALIHQMAVGSPMDIGVGFRSANWHKVIMGRFMLFCF